MSAAPEAFAQLAEQLRQETDRATQDRYLDLWIDYRDRATEWDAEQWGLSDVGT